MMLASNLARYARDHARALHPCSARSLWRSLALLLLLGLGTTPAHADLKLCNTTASRVGVSIGYKDAEGWATEGWWNIASHTCETLLKGVLIGRYYYIHAVEASRQPERALACADHLPSLVPGAGHLVHMPAHIYARVGKYHESSVRNAEAAHADEQYLAGAHLTGDYADGYYSHNLHFLWASLMMEGRSAEALQAATALQSTITEAEVRKNRGKEEYLATKLFTLIRFGRWEDLLRESPPPKGLHLVEGIWRLGRGLALVATGRLPGAEGERQALVTLTKQFRRSKNQQDKLERELLQIAERLLAGQAAVQRQRYDEAIKALKEGIKIEDSLQDAEPPRWPLSVRHYLGPVLLVASRPAEAEIEYRADLKRYPENGWGLFGLVQSLKAQQKDSEAAEASERFEKSWTYADVTLSASHF